MAKKLKALAEEAGSENQLAAKIKDSANQIWLAGLGAFAKAQAEGGKMFESLGQEGEAMQNKARKTAEETLSEVKSKATGTWDKLEQVFEDRVARALHSLSVPTRKDVDSLVALYFTPHQRAGHGGSGRGGQCSGKNGKSLDIPVFCFHVPRHGFLGLGLIASVIELRPCIDKVIWV